MNIIEALQHEIIDLIGLQGRLLLEISQQKDIWQDDDRSTTLHPEKIKEYRQRLKNDEVKVKDLESIVAVVGTMKAGKSTTINALIGQEILPNRVMPMTTLPTLIRHKAGMKDPIMRIGNLSLFHNLAKKVKNEITRKEGADFSNLQEVVDEIVHKDSTLEPSYIGVKNIHKALYFINDLFRLVGHLEIHEELEEFLKSFRDIKSLPTIEVEFGYLASLGDGFAGGSLALLDTPGPNEAGQSGVLKGILSDQIKNNASIVLFVMNYTQLNSEQDADVRNQINDIKDIFKDRSFVIVNRFDEKKSNGLGEKETKRLAADLVNNGVCDEFIGEHDVFPVSSFLAFVANSVKLQLDSEFDICNFVRDPANKDFIENAFGAIEDEDLDEITQEDISKRCERLIKKSMYSEFVGSMLEKAYMKAGENSLLSSLSTLREFSKEIDSFAAIVSGGLAEELNDLNKTIEITSNLVEQMKNAKESALKIKNNGVMDYKKRAEAVLKENKESMIKSLRGIFSTEMVSIKGEMSNREQELKQERDGNRKVFGMPMTKAQERRRKVLDAEIKSIRETIDQKGEGGVIDFMENKEQADKFSSEILKIIKDNIDGMEEDCGESLANIEAGIKKELEKIIVDEIEEIFKKYEDFMKKRGYEYSNDFVSSFSLNVSPLNPLELDAELLNSDKVTKDKTKEVEVVREGFWHKTLKIISFGLRRDTELKVMTVKEESTVYKVNISDCIKHATERADTVNNKWIESVAEIFDKELIPIIEKEFAKILDHISCLSGDLDNAKKLHMKNKNVVEDAKSFMGLIKDRNNVVDKRVGTARHGLEAMSARKGAVHA